MKILSLCTSPDRGGLELYAFQTVQLFADNGCLETTVARAATPFRDWIRASQIDVELLEPKGTWPLTAARALAQLIDSRGIDLIHINWGRDLNLAVLGKRFSKRKPALIYSRHMRIPSSKRDVYHRWIYNHVDCLLTTTREMYNQARSNLPITHARIQQLNLGVWSRQQVNEEECARFFDAANLERGRFSIGLIGRIELGKGQHLLIEALGMLTEVGCDLQACIIGHPMSAEYYRELGERIVRSGLSQRVSLQGFFPDVSRFMSCFDLVVLTSDCEHFGMVLIEAMHAGVAIIGTNAGGVPEIIEDGKTGLLCEPRNAADLADKIKLIYTDPLKRKSLSDHGRARAQEQFSGEEHFEHLYRRFKQVLGEST